MRAFFVLDFDEDGNLSVDVKKDGTVSADTLIKSLLQAERYNEIRTYAVDNDTTFVPVKNFSGSIRYSKRQYEPCL